MKRVDDVLDKALLQFGRGKTAEQRQRNQKNIVELRKMIDRARIINELKNI